MSQITDTLPNAAKFMQSVKYLFTSETEVDQFSM